MKSSLSRLLFALATLVISLGVYGMWYATIVSKSVVVAGLENKINAKTETAKRIASARATLGEISGDEATIGNYFISEDDVVAFIDDLEARGRAQGAIVNVLSVSNGVVGTHTTLTLALSVKGPFDAVLRTVGAIEYAPYDLSISALSLGLDAKSAWRADFSVIVGTKPAVTPIPK